MPEHLALFTSVNSHNEPKITLRVCHPCDLEYHNLTPQNHHIDIRSVYDFYYISRHSSLHLSVNDVDSLLFCDLFSSSSSFSLLFFSRVSACLYLLQVAPLDTANLIFHGHPHLPPPILLISSSESYSSISTILDTSEDMKEVADTFEC